MYLEKTV